MCILAPFKTEQMNREELIHYIRENDAYFQDANFDKYSYYELMIIKVSLEVEKAKRELGAGEQLTGH